MRISIVLISLLLSERFPLDYLKATYRMVRHCIKMVCVRGGVCILPSCVPLFCACGRP